MRLQIPGTPLNQKHNEMLKSLPTVQNQIPEYRHHKLKQFKFGLGQGRHLMSYQ